VGEQCVQSVDRLRPGADKIVAVFGQEAQGRMASSTAAVLSRVAVWAVMPTDKASAWSVLRLCPVDSIRAPRASSAGTSTTSTPSAASRAVSAAPRPVAPSIAQKP
jgi:hypothetical protein